MTQKFSCIYDMLITPTNNLSSNTGSVVYGALNTQCSMLPHTQGICVTLNSEITLLFKEACIFHDS